MRRDDTSRVGRLSRPPGEQDKIGRLTSVQWKVDDTALIDNLRYGRILRLNHRCVGGYVYVVRNAADLKDDGNLDVISNLQNDAGLLIALEQRSCYFDLVGTDRKIQQVVTAFAVADGILRETGVDLCRLDSGSDNNSSTWFLNDAVNLRVGNCLSV